MAVSGFVRPTVKCLARHGDVYAKFSVQPLERGFGTTLGNSLRRVLLSFVPGAAITGVKIDGVLHEFTTIPGVYEDVLEITMRLKEVYIKVDETIYSDPDETITLTLDVAGKGKVSAADIKVPTGVEVVNPEAHIATITDDGASLSMELLVRKGVGYHPVEDHPHRQPRPLGLIPVDAIFTPTKRVNIFVEPTRVGHRTDFERLVLEVWTNGAIPPEQAVTTAAQWLDRYLRTLFEIPAEVEEKVEEEILPEVPESELLAMSIDRLDFSKRTSNCLHRERVETLGDLVARTPKELSGIRNLGEISLKEIVDKLAALGLRLREEG